MSSPSATPRRRPSYSSVNHHFYLHQISGSDGAPEYRCSTSKTSKRASLQSFTSSPSKTEIRRRPSSASHSRPHLSRVATGTSTSTTSSGRSSSAVSSAASSAPSSIPRSASSSRKSSLHRHRYRQQPNRTSLSNDLSPPTSPSLGPLRAASPVCASVPASPRLRATPQYYTHHQLPPRAGSAPPTASAAADPVTIPVASSPPSQTYANNLVWRNLDALRAEYAAVDRRRRTVWGWVRQRVRSCTGVDLDPDEQKFWEEGGREGSVRRYRLVLPEDKELGETVEHASVSVKEKEKGRKLGAGLVRKMSKKRVKA